MKRYFYYPVTGIVFLICLVKSTQLLGQSTPAAQALQYNQAFAIVHGTTVYPAGIQGWNLGTAASATFRTTAPTANSNLLANSTAATTTTGVHNYNGKIGILASPTGDPSIGLAINTIGKSSIQVRFNAMTIRNPWDGVTNTMINGFDLQYRVGSISGTWTSATGNANGFYQNNMVLQTGAVTTPQNQMAQIINLPAACDNQSAVYLRWVVRDISGSGNRPSFAIDDIVICPIATPSITITGPTATCSGQTMHYVANPVNGGTTPTYSWRRNGLPVGSNSQNFSMAGLVAGDQIMCILTSSQGCLTTTTANSNTITLVSAAAPVISSAIVTANCNNGNTGAINLNTSGGTGPFTFAWDTSNTATGLTNVVTVGIETAANPNPPGIGLSFYVNGIETKELWVTKGLTYNFSVGGGHPFHIATQNIGAIGTPNIVTNGQTGAPTGGGTVTLRPNNLHPAQVYYPCASHVNMGWNINIINGWNIEDPHNLRSGIYNVVMTDANGCTASTQSTVPSVSATLNVSAVVTNETCGTADDGQIDLSVSGGTGPYTICWDTTNIDNGGIFNVTFAAKTAAHPMFGQGSAFGYVVNGVEGKELLLTRGLTYSFAAVVPNHPFRITTDLAGGTPNNVVTSGQSGAPTQNGTVLFTPNVSHPSQLYYSCEFHQFMGYNANINDGYCTEDLTGLAAGTYSVIVRDANGCTTTAQFIVGEPPPVNLAATVTPANCFGSNTGSIDLDVTGGSGPYTVCWDTLNQEGGSMFVVTFGPKTAAHPLFGQGSANGYIVNGVEGKDLHLTRGIKYDFSVMATNHPFRITTDLQGASPNNVVANGQTGAPTENGIVSFQPDNTHPSLLYYSCEFHAFMGYNVNINDGHCVEDISNMKAGNYNVIVTDQDGCTTTAEYTITEPGPLTLSAAITEENCTSKNGAIDLSISGGTGPYTVCWDTTNIKNGVDFAVTFGPKTAVHPMFGQGSLNGYIVNDVEGEELSLTKGIKYFFNVMAPGHPFRITTDLEGGSANNVVAQGQEGAPTVNGIVSFVPDNSHGSLLYYSCEFHLYMGYKVNIVDGYCTEDITALSTGSYSVIVTDANGCTATATYVVNQVPIVAEICGNGLDDDCNELVDDGCNVELDLKVFIEGYYTGGGQMQPVLFNQLVTLDQSVCDTVDVELHDANTPYALVMVQEAILNTDGTCHVSWPYSVFGNSYYLVVRHRNSIEVWSKTPFLFDSFIKSFDFTVEN